MKITIIYMAFFVCITACANAQEIPDPQASPQAPEPVLTPVSVTNLNSIQIGDSYNRTRLAGQRPVLTGPDLNVAGSAQKISRDGTDINSLAITASSHSSRLGSAYQLSLEATSGTTDQHDPDFFDFKKAISTIYNASYERDLNIGNAGFGRLSIGRQKAFGKELVPVGVQTQLPLQGGISGRASASGELSFGQFTNLQSDPKILLRGLVDLGAQFCASLSRADADKNLLCVKFNTEAKIGQITEGTLEGALLLAHKIQNGSEKTFFYVEPGLSGTAVSLFTNAPLTNVAAQATLNAGFTVR